MAECEERLRLLLEYQNLMQAYAEAIGRLTRKHISQHDYESLSQATEKARQDSTAARERLDRHIAEHGCNVGFAVL